jgi:hypothetical protein
MLDVPSSRAPSRRQSNCADVRFARPNIQIYDAHVVDLYQRVFARYLVGVRGADTTAKRDLNSALDRISERITLTSNPKVRSGGQLPKYFNTIWRREWDSNPRYGFPHTRFPSVRLKPLGHLSGCLLLKRHEDFCKRMRQARSEIPTSN